MSVEPGSEALSFRLQPSIADMSAEDQARVAEIAGKMCASNDVFRIGLSAKRMHPMRFSLLRHPRMRSYVTHNAHALALSRVNNAIMHISAEFTYTGAIDVAADEMHYEIAAHDAGYTQSLVALIAAELARLNVNPGLPMLSKLHVLLKVILDQATLMYYAQVPPGAPTR